MEQRGQVNTYEPYKWEDGRAMKRVVKLKFDHLFCPSCESIQPVSIHAVGRDATDQFEGTDLVCRTCRFLVVTVYDRVKADEPVMVEGEQ